MPATDNIDGSGRVGRILLDDPMDTPSPATRETRIKAVANDLFAHVRVLLMCATLLALGLVARSRSSDLLGAALFEGLIGWGVIALAAFLAMLNLWIGVNRLKQWKHWKMFSVVLFAAYVMIAHRVLEIVALIHLDGK